MDHLQTSSLSDVMQLLPGVEITNPKLSSNYITIRNSSSLGTSIIVDGLPLFQRKHAGSAPPLPEERRNNVGY